jgi:pimeloyl-ACP methyl ester carboxylesterase
MRTAAVVLLHSPLADSGIWAALVPALRSRGHNVIVPDYSDVLAGAPKFYPKIAAAVAAELRADGLSGEIVLIGHSGAGGVLPAIAGTLNGNVTGAIFVDAILPHPGNNWFATAPDGLGRHLRGLARDGMLPPWHLWWPANALNAMLPDIGVREAFIFKLRALPLSYFEETAPSDILRTSILCSYLRLSPAYDEEANRAHALGWRTANEELSHLGMLTHPDIVAAALHQLIGAPT